jgi:hypothetical protein
MHLKLCYILKILILGPCVFVAGFQKQKSTLSVTSKLLCNIMKCVDFPTQIDTPKIYPINCIGVIYVKLCCIFG